MLHCCNSSEKRCSDHFDPMYFFTENTVKRKKTLLFTFFLYYWGWGSVFSPEYKTHSDFGFLPRLNPRLLNSSFECVGSETYLLPGLQTDLFTKCDADVKEGTFYLRSQEFARWFVD